MRLIHAPLLLAILSGISSRAEDDTLIGITCFLNEDVILPCNCRNSSFSKNFKWKFVNENGTAELIYNLTTFVETYKSRTEKLNDCSIHLKNLKLEDTGNYTCSFRKDGLYRKHNINLRVDQQPTAVAVSAAPHVKSPHHSRHNFIIFPIIVLLLVVGCLWNLYLKQRTNQSAQNPDVTGVPEDV